MIVYDASLLTNEDVLRNYATLLRYESRLTAAILVYVAEIDARNLYLAEGYESMKAFCIAKMQLTDDAAFKRLQVARVGKQFPQVFRAMACGRLTLSGARLLAPRLNSSNVDELIEAASLRTVQEIELILATRYPRPEVLPLDDGVTPQTMLKAERDDRDSTQVVVTQRPNGDPVATWQPEFVKPPDQVAIAPRLRPTLEPLSATRFNLQVNLSKETHDKLRYLQDLLGHSVPNGNLAEVIDRALDEAIPQYERRKFGVGARRKTKPGVRSIPAQIKKAVFDRDGGQCTFRYQDGTRCQKTKPLEFDHVVPLAKGGKTTVDNLRLLCRAHNQHAADQAFGQRFMDEKRASGAARAAWRRGSARARSRS